METNSNKIIFDVTVLREQKRPLWMSELGMTSFAEMLGDGGDIYTDRLTPDWPRYSGEELLDADLEQYQQHESELPEEVQFSTKDAQDSVVAEAFRYVHQPDKKEK